MAGGSLEQVVAGSPFYKGKYGRGFVVALEPKTGKVIWKYDVGSKPEPLTPPIKIKDSFGDHTFYYGPATSSVWSTPSFDAETGTIFFGTDVNTAPRRPTPDDPRLYTSESCAVIAVDVEKGTEKWVTQINPGDVWTNSMRSYDPKRRAIQGPVDRRHAQDLFDRGGRENRRRSSVWAARTAASTFCRPRRRTNSRAHASLYRPAVLPALAQPDRRMLALPSCIGGLQTGCATDGRTIFTNGIDALQLGSQEKPADSGVPPTGGRVVAISLDTQTELWRHERPRVATLGGPAPKPIYTDVGDPVGSGIAVANGVVYFTTVASGKLVALDAATGSLLKEIDLGPVWSGPSVSRGRVYVGTGNTLFSRDSNEGFFPKKYSGELYSFGVPGDDEIGRLGAGNE